MAAFLTEPGPQNPTNPKASIFDIAKNVIRGHNPFASNLVSPLPSEGRANPNRLMDLANLVTQTERRKRAELKAQQVARRKERPEVKGVMKERQKQIERVQSPEFEGFTTAPVPRKFSSLISDSAQENDVDPRVIASMLFTESGIQAIGPDKDNLNRDKETGEVISRDRGIAQINDVAHPEISDEQAYDPIFAINFMAQEVARLLDVFDGDINKAIRAYNAGAGGTRQGGGKDYLKKVAKGLSPSVRKEMGIKLEDDEK